MTTPGWLKSLAIELSPELSVPPNELLTTLAPSETASFSALPRSSRLDEFASTRMIVHSRQIEWTLSTSSDSSVDQPVVSFAGSEVVLPVWLTTVRQPLPVLQVGRP